MLNRTKAPKIKEIKNLSLPDYSLYHLDNGIPVYEINMGTQEVIKLEIIFNAGRPFEQKKLASRGLGYMLNEGTVNFDSAAIAEKVDYYGGSLEFPVSLDTINIVLYCLSQHFGQLIPLIKEILTQPVFPESELETFKKRNRQRLQVELTKSEVIAYRTITEKIFGASHPYGYNSIPETYDALKREDIIQHFQHTFFSNNCQVFISGKPTERHRKLLNQCLGTSLKPGELPSPHSSTEFFKPEKIHIGHQDKLQTALRVGRRLFGRSHEDFNDMYILNTVLGGYFGSRLMTNIREKKGYTYNIYSTLDAMLLDGYLLVATEVSNAFVNDTLKEIYREFQRLREERINDGELKMVKNYLLGNLLTLLDGPFSVADVIKTQKMEDLPDDYFVQLVQAIKNITPDRLQVLSNTYLRKEDMWEVVVGD
ncbi:MAG: insulinase family protein [Bacteroidetes bacterium]|nr:insulinase family protein [Bacteroidota bacterium]